MITLLSSGSCCCAHACVQRFYQLRTPSLILYRRKVFGNYGKTWPTASLASGVALALDLKFACVSADPDRLEQVLINLLSNALKHTPAGGGVTVTLQTEGRVRLTVADTGPGFGGEPGRLFERFYKGEGSSGSGLGLTFVETLVDLHGGSVTATNMPGEGAAFEVRLAPTTLAPPHASIC